MTVMLVAMFAAAGVGMFARAFGRLQVALCLLIAAIMTLAYFLRPWYMT